MQRIFLGIAVVLFILAGCETETTTPSVPVLLADNTLDGVTALSSAPPTVSSTVSIRVTEVPPFADPLSERPSATPHSLWNLPHWLDAKTPGMRTATLLPTRTPFATDTPTLTRTPTRPPTATASRTATRTASPSPGFAPIYTVTPEGCTHPWFFRNAPQTCPVDEALIQPGIFLTFERGAMIWLGTEKNILILFNSADTPRWLLLPDPYQAGMVESDPAVVPPPGLFQPQRGFGLLWRGNPGIRERLGWAISLEVGYNAAAQLDAVLGIRYVRGPSREVYILLPEQTDWSITQ